MNIAILGAGFGGLAAAHDLASAGHQVTIFEAAGYHGGLAAGFKAPGWDWALERFYHHWFLSDRHLLGLLDELDLRRKLIVVRPKTVMFHQGRFYPFDSIPAALLYPGLGWGLDKIRFGLVGLYLRLTNNWRLLEQVTAHEWMLRWAGERVYRSMWEPLLIGKFGPYARQVNMAWMWARIKARTTSLGTYEGGFQACADDIAAHLTRRGVTIHLNTPLQRIESAPQGGVLLTTPTGQAHFDQCLVTSAPHQLARLAPSLPAGYLSGLLSLQHMGAVVLILALKQRLSPEGYYWYNIPKSAGFPFLALVEHTNFLPAEHYAGQTLVYCGDYLESGHEYFNLSKEQLVERFLPALQRVNPAFQADWVSDSWLFSTAYAQPVPLVNHSQNIPAIQTPLPGLYFASMSQVYPWDRGTNFAVEIGRRAARLMLEGA